VIREHGPSMVGPPPHQPVGTRLAIGPSRPGRSLGAGTGFRRRRGGLAVALVAAVTLVANIQNPPAASAATLCHNNPAQDTAALRATLAAAPPNGTVTVAAGTCALSANLPVHNAVTINGAGPGCDLSCPACGGQHLSDHGSAGDRRERQPRYGHLQPWTRTAREPKAGGPVQQPQQHHDPERHGQAGSGFGMRITGRTPCASYSTAGIVVDSLSITNTGAGGFSSLDIDCTNGAQLSNISIHGNYLALYQDENVTL
jgi:hypothetical protein